MAIVQQHLLHPIGESFVLTFANTTNGKSIYAGNYDVDDEGNIYVCCHDADEANILKISSDGNIIWRKRITDEDNSAITSSIAVDQSSGDVYFTGGTYANLGYMSVGYQLMIGKYNSSGARQWLKIFGDGYQYVGQWNAHYLEQTSLSIGARVYADSSGFKCRAFVEQACGAGFSDIHLSSFLEVNPSGTLTRQRETSDFSTDSNNMNNCPNPWYNYSDRSISYGNLTKSRVSNHYYAAGSYRGVSRHQESGDQWSCIAKFDSSGDLVWNKKFRYNNSGVAPSTNGSRDVFQDISLDSNDNLYTVSAAVQQGASPQNRNPLVMKINSSGTLQWIRRLASTTVGLSESYINNVFVDPDNDDNIFCMGSIKVYGTHNWGTDQTIRHLTKYNSSGTLQWQRLIAGFFPNYQTLKVKGGFIYMMGSSSWGVGTNGNQDRVLLKIPKSGNLAGLITHDSNTFSVRNGGDNGNFNIYIDGGTSTGMSSTVNPSYAYFNNFTNRYTYNGSVAFVNATNNSDGSSFGDLTSNVTCTKTSLGYYT